MPLTIDSSQLGAKMKAFVPKVYAAALVQAQTEAVRLEYLAKQNRPWTDRTGLAKARLNARVSTPSATTIRITLAHGVEYGIWLELAHGKNWAVVMPTLEKEAPAVFKRFSGLFNKVGGL